MSFGQAMYIVNEDAGVVQVSLILNNELSFDTSIKVLSIDISAEGICA